MVTCPADRFSYRVHIIGACAPRWPIHHARTRGRRRRATRCSALRDRSIPRPARIIELLSRQSNCRYKCYWQFFPWDSIVQEIEWLETETMNAAGPDDAALEKSAYRKASLRILPLIALGYGAAYIDRVNISFASMQMNRDLNFSATVYGFGAGLFFLSYGGGRELSRCALAGKIRPRYASPTTHRDALHYLFRPRSVRCFRCGRPRPLALLARCRLPPSCSSIRLAVTIFVCRNARRESRSCLSPVTRKSASPS